MTVGQLVKSEYPFPGMRISILQQCGRLSTMLQVINVESGRGG